MKVRLDDPWEKGNPIRAELGKMVGRSSVPCIFIGGKYVGGYDGGVGDDSPGILEMAFKGTLREKLVAGCMLLILIFLATMNVTRKRSWSEQIHTFPNRRRFRNVDSDLNFLTGFNVSSSKSTSNISSTRNPST